MPEVTIVILGHILRLCDKPLSKRRFARHRFSPGVTALENRSLLTSYTLTTLASFDGANGSFPFGDLVMDSEGNLYGTAFLGGADNLGTVFEIPQGSTTITTLVSFNGADGAYPSFECAGPIIDRQGNVYGTAAGGTGWDPSDGDDGSGTLFEIANGSNAFSTFAFNSGSGLTIDGKGNLYGTLFAGGAYGDGSVYEIPYGSRTMTVLATFNGTDGSGPDGSLAIDSQGNLYGTTTRGGSSAAGTVFEIVGGSNTITTLASFDYANGAEPVAGVVLDGQGDLFGTTTTSAGGNDGGTIFEIAQGSDAITTLASFSGDTGYDPQGGFALDSQGNLYGTTAGLAYEPGDAFELAKGSNTITPLAWFTGADGSSPMGGVVLDGQGDIYGTTEKGGTANDGTVFELVADGIQATTPTFSSDGGVDYGYQINGTLPQATTVDLDWASGTTVDTVIGDPIVSTATETAEGMYDLNATPAQLGTPPPGATDLLVVADPDNLISPADPSKVASLSLSYQWTGDGPDDPWSDGDNWQGGVAPGTDANLVFPTGANQLTSEDDLGVSFNSITTSDDYEFSAPNGLKTNDLTVQQGSLTLDDPATVTGTVEVTSGTTLTIGPNATLGGQSKIMVDPGGTLDDEGSVTIDSSDPVSIQGRLVVGPSATLDDEDAATVSNEGRINVFGQTTVGNSGTLTVSEGSLFIGVNASLSDSGNLTLDSDASLDVGGSFAVSSGGAADLSGLVSVGAGATFSDNGGSLTEDAGGVIGDEGDLTVGTGGSASIGGICSITSGGEVSTGDNSGSIPITSSTPVPIEAADKAAQVGEISNLVADPVTKVAEVLKNSLATDIATVQAADDLAAWAKPALEAGLTIKYGADIGVLVTALNNNDQQAFAAGYSKLARDILTDAAAITFGELGAYVVESTAIADDGLSLALGPLGALVGAIGGSGAMGLYYDQELKAGMLAIGAQDYSFFKSLITNATTDSGGNLNDMGSVTVQATGELSDEDSVTVATGSTLDVFGILNEEAGGNLKASGTVTIERGGVLNDFSPATIDAGGALNIVGAATVETGAAMKVAGTLSVAQSGSLVVYGTAVLSTSAVYQPLGNVVVESGGYLGSSQSTGSPASAHHYWPATDLSPQD